MLSLRLLTAGAFPRPSAIAAARNGRVDHRAASLEFQAARVTTDTRDETTWFSHGTADFPELPFRASFRVSGDPDLVRSGCGNGDWTGPSGTVPSAANLPRSLAAFRYNESDELGRLQGRALQE
jgi:hypothetical protein